MKISLVIPLVPTAWTPSRVMRAGFAYNPKDKQKKASRAIVSSLYQGEIYKGPVSAQLFFYLPIPKATSKKKRVKMLGSEILHTKKPDLDNCLKFFFDCIKGIIIYDDNQITHFYAYKRYSDNPRTEADIYFDEEGNYEKRKYASCSEE